MWALIWSWFTLPIPYLACRDEAEDALIQRWHSGRALAQCLACEPQSQVPTDCLITLTAARFYSKSAFEFSIEAFSLGLLSTADSHSKNSLNWDSSPSVNPQEPVTGLARVLPPARGFISFCSQMHSPFNNTTVPLVHTRTRAHKCIHIHIHKHSFQDCFTNF